MKAIVSAISTLITFFGNLISNVGNFVGMIFKGVTALPSYFAYIPSMLVAMLVIIVSIAVVTRLVGRE